MATWAAVIGTSVIAFALKYIGHSIPEKYLTNKRALRINILIPIALLSALVAVNTVVKDGRLVLDQRITGLAVAAIALILKAPFPVVVLGAAASSAIVYRLG